MTLNRWNDNHAKFSAYDTCLKWPSSRSKLKLVGKDIDVNEHDRLSNITFKWRPQINRINFRKCGAQLCSVKPPVCWLMSGLEQPRVDNSNMGPTWDQLIQLS